MAEFVSGNCAARSLNAGAGIFPSRVLSSPVASLRSHNNIGITGCVNKCYWKIHILVHTSGHRKITLNIPAHRTYNDSIIIVHSS